jgi:hypothetical protein
VEDELNVEEAIRLAEKVLDEERHAPTVHYLLRQPVVSMAAPAALAYRERGQHPRTVQPTPGAHQFSSENYGLLVGFFSELDTDGRTRFINALCRHIAAADTYQVTKGDVLGTGSWRRTTSELPLIAECLIRQRYSKELLAALPRAPLRPGLTMLLLQLEEIIAFDFTLLSDSDYATLRDLLPALSARIDQLRRETRVADVTESNIRYHLVEEVPPICDGLTEMCRKAVFLRLRESRTSDVNTEIQTDRDQVGSFLQRLSFSKVLIASLEQAERSYREATNAFEYKECMSHLRSFLEDMHKEACVLVHRKRGGVLPATWGKAIAYLAQEAVLTKSEEEFVTALYRLISDAGVHPLVAEREHARLMRNMNIEYGLLFLTRLDKWMGTP